MPILPGRTSCAADTNRDRLLSIGPDERSLALEIVAIVEPACPLVI